MREEARALRAWLKVRGSFPGPIFLSKQKRPIDRTTLHLLMKKYGAAAGIPPPLRHFHVLKHCCATHFLSKGFGVERVQDWIGHANIQSIRRPLGRTPRLNCCWCTCSSLHLFAGRQAGSVYYFSGGPYADP